VPFTSGDDQAPTKRQNTGFQAIVDSGASVGVKGSETAGTLGGYLLFEDYDDLCEMSCDHAAVFFLLARGSWKRRSRRLSSPVSEKCPMPQENGTRDRVPLWANRKRKASGLRLIPLQYDCNVPAVNEYLEQQRINNWLWVVRDMMHSLSDPDWREQVKNYGQLILGSGSLGVRGVLGFCLGSSRVAQVYV
jgi:hypothetical protein